MKINLDVENVDGLGVKKKQWKRKTSGPNLHKI